MNSYINPWKSETNAWMGPVIYTNNAPVYRTHRGVTVYRVHKEQFDCVLDGMAITQLAGFSTTDHLDELLDGMRPCTGKVCEHLRKNGFRAIAYDDADTRKYIALYGV